MATAYRSRIDLSGVMAVGLSQSGRTQEIVETLQWARDCGASIVGITNGAGSPLAELADVALVTEAGVEQAVPATKTFTCQLAALAVLALGLGADLDAGLLRQLPEVVEELLGRATAPGYGIAEIVAELAAVDGLVVSARGLAYSAALELALKIKEACYLHAMGISYADLQHGPIAVVDSSTPAIIMAADSGPTLDAAVGLARRVTSAGARAYTIGGGAELAAVSSRALAGPALPEWLAPDRPDHPRAAAHRRAVTPAGHRPRQPARPEQGHPDLLTGRVTRWGGPVAAGPAWCGESLWGLRDASKASQVSRCTLCWAAWARGRSTMRSTLTCEGRVTAQATASATSSAVSGSATPA